jgi:hypothetical protein
LDVMKRNTTHKVIVPSPYINYYELTEALDKFTCMCPWLVKC